MSRRPHSFKILHMQQATHSNVVCCACDESGAILNSYYEQCHNNVLQVR